MLSCRNLILELHFCSKLYLETHVCQLINNKETFALQSLQQEYRKINWTQFIHISIQYINCQIIRETFQQELVNIGDQYLIVVVYQWTIHQNYWQSPCINWLLPYTHVARVGKCIFNISNYLKQCIVINISLKGNIRTSNLCLKPLYLILALKLNEMNDWVEKNGFAKFRHQWEHIGSLEYMIYLYKLWTLLMHIICLVRGEQKAVYSQESLLVTSRSGSGF